MISFGSYVATFGPHLKEKGWSHLDPIGGHLRPHNKKQGCCHLLPMLRSWARTAPPSVHSYKSDCRTVGTDPPNRGYIPLGRDTGCRTNAVQTPHTAWRPNNPDGPSCRHTDMPPRCGGPIGEVYPILSVLTVVLFAQVLLRTILPRFDCEA